MCRGQRIAVNTRIIFGKRVRDIAGALQQGRVNHQIRHGLGSFGAYLVKDQRIRLGEWCLRSPGLAMSSAVGAGLEDGDSIGALPNRR